MTGGDRRRAGAPPSDGAVGLAVVIASRRPARLERLLELLRPQVEGRARRRLIVVHDAGRAGDYAGAARRHRLADFVAAPDGGGAAAARNLGAARADRDFLVFVDDDSEPPPYWLDWLASVLAENPDVDAVGGTTRAPPSRAGLFEHFLAECGFAPGPWVLGGRLMHLSAANAAVRRALFEAAGGFDARLAGAEDHGLTRRLARLGAVFYVDASWFVYRAATSPPAHLRRCYRFGRDTPRAPGLEERPAEGVSGRPKGITLSAWAARAAKRVRDERERPEYRRRPPLKRYLFAALGALSLLAVDLGFARSLKLAERA